MRRKYFISYAHKSGFGNCELTIDTKIEEMDIRELHKMIIERYPELIEVVVLFFKERK